MVFGNKGFSLVGVILAAAVGVVIMSALATQIISSSRQVHFLEAKMESMNLKQELSLLLATDANCQSSFASLTGINLANSTGGDYTTITSQLTGTNPLKILSDAYTSKDRYIQVNDVQLYKPLNKVDGTANNGSPYEFKVKFIAQEKTSVSAPMMINVDGPTVVLNITGTSVDAAPNACVAAPTPCRSFGTRGFNVLPPPMVLQSYWVDLGQDFKMASAGVMWPVGAQDCGAAVTGKSGTNVQVTVGTNQGVYTCQISISYCY